MNLSFSLWTKIAHKWRLYKVRRTAVVFACFFGGVYAGYMFSGYGKNMYTQGYMNGFYQPYDYSLHLMNSYGGDEKAKYSVQIQSFLKQG